MRAEYRHCQLLHLFSVLLAIASIVLTFLILFAGSKPNFLEDYAIVTVNTSLVPQMLFTLFGLTFSQLNTSRIGSINDTSSSSSSNPLINLIHAGESAIEQDISSLVNSVAKDVGLADFYSMHILDHCQGRFVPGPVPNATLPLGKIKHNVTSCSNRTAFSTFDPTAELQATLNETHTGVTLQQLGWPSQLSDDITALKDVLDAVFVLYCVGLGFAFFSLLQSLFFSTHASSGLSRLGSALCHFLITGIAALCLAIASVAITVVAVKAAHIINKYGNDIGVSGNWGGKFLALTWASTGCLLVAMVVGFVSICCGGRRRREAYYEK